jgi:hypothetical protein
MKVIEEKNGYKLGINENPDIAHLKEDRRWQVEEPDGDRYSGNKESITKLFNKLNIRG